MRSSSCRVAATPVLAGEWPTLRSSDILTQTHRQTHALSPQGSAGGRGADYASIRMSVCVFEMVLSRTRVTVT